MAPSYQNDKINPRKFSRFLSNQKLGEIDISYISIIPCQFIERFLNTFNLLQAGSIVKRPPLMLTGLESGRGQLVKINKDMTEDFLRGIKIRGGPSQPIRILDVSGGL